MELATCHGAGNYGTFGSPVMEEIGGLVRKIFWLYVHIEPATGEQDCHAAQASKSSQAIH
jgi:hypothetical protein